MLHPSTVHLCISRKCTAEKWIFSAPLSQKVFRQTLHCTRFLPVAGLMNWVPKLTGTAPHWRFAGDWGLRIWLEEDICGPDIEFDRRGRPGPWCDLGLRGRDSRVKFKALWWWLFCSSLLWSLWSLFASLRCSIDDDEFLLFFDMLAELFIRLENDDAIRLAANGFNAFGCGGMGKGKWWPAIAAIFIKPAAWFGNADLSLPVDSDMRRRAAWAAATCCKWWRSNSGLNLVVWCDGGNPANRRKSNGCIFCKWFNGLDDPISVDAIVVGEWLLFKLALLHGDDDGLLKKLFRWFGGNPAANFWCIWFDNCNCVWANDPRCMFIGWVAKRGGDKRLLGDITICFCSDKKSLIDWFALWNSNNCW